jgi:AraC-like DNA-binding protein
MRIFTRFYPVILNPNTRCPMTPVIEHPSVAFKNVISHFLFLRSEDGDTQFSDRFIPDGHTALVMNFKGIIHTNINGKRDLLPPAFIVPPAIRSLIIEGVPPIDSMVVIFKTTAFSKIFSQRMDQMNSMHFKPAGIVITNDQYGFIGSACEKTERINRFEKVLSQHLHYDHYVPDTIDGIYERIHNSGGNLPVGSIPVQYGMNERTFRRRFRKRVGICAKSLSRIIRVNKVWEYMLHGHAVDFFDVICKFGFHDQSHLIRDFREIVGETPRSFFLRDHQQARMISGRDCE